MNKIIIALLLFTFIGVGTCEAGMDVMGMLKYSQEQHDKAEERGRQQIKKFGKDTKAWGQSAKMRRIEKTLLELDIWNKANLMKIMNKYNASLDEMNRAMSNVKSFDRYTR